MSSKDQTKLAAIFTCLLFSTACSVKESKRNTDSPLAINNASYAIVEKQALTTGQNTLSGQGSVVFLDPLAGKAHNFLLAFELQEGGSLTLVAGSDNKLQEGLALVFSRESAVLKLVTMAGDNASSSTEIEGVDASSPLTLNLDIHNGETPAHVLIWKNSDTSELLVDTEEGTETAGNGKGILWGLKLNAAKVTRAEIRASANEE